MASFTIKDIQFCSYKPKYDDKSNKLYLSTN